MPTTEIYRDSSAPSLDAGVRARLFRLDPDLQVVFSSLAIDLNTSRPIVTKAGRMIPDPYWTVWSKGGDGAWRPVTQHRTFGHREVAQLEADVARTMKVSAIVEKRRRLNIERRRRELEQSRERRSDFRKANKRRLHDRIFEGKVGVRQGRISSYAGQTQRATPGLVRMGDKEDGWENVWDETRNQ